MIKDFDKTIVDILASLVSISIFLLILGLDGHMEIMKMINPTPNHNVQSKSQF